MKKIFKIRIKKWKIGDYVRQFSIVTGGVLLTLWLTGYIAESSKQKEVQQAIQLIALELRNNMQTVRDCEEAYTTEKQMALHLQAEGFSIKNFPSDTVKFYQQRLYGGMVLPYNFSTNALEMLKTSGLASHITDKQLLIDLLNCYGSIESFNKTIDIYFSMRKDVLAAYNQKNPQETTPTETVDFIAIFGEMTADVNIKSWLCLLPRAFDTQFFEKYKTEIDKTIAKLETAYK